MSAERTLGAATMAPPQDARSIREQVRQRVEAARAEHADVRVQVQQTTEVVPAQGAPGGSGQGGAVGVPIPPPPTTVQIMPDGSVRVSEIVPPEPVIVHEGQPDMPVPPEMIREIALGFFVMIAFIAVALPLLRLIGRIVDRRNAAPAAIPADVGARLDRIEQAVEAVAIEVERISEGQRFTSRLISELRAAPQLERVHEPRG